jgi:hypothetical protein
MPVINSVAYKASVFVSASHFLPAQTNTPAHYATEFIMIVISFMIQAQLYHEAYYCHNRLFHRIES